MPGQQMTLSYMIFEELRLFLSGDSAISQTYHHMQVSVSKEMKEWVWSRHDHSLKNPGQDIIELLTPRITGSFGQPVLPR